MLRAGTPDSAAWVLHTLQGAGVHAMGRRSFEDMASYWATSTHPMAAAMNDIPKVVFTREKSFDPAANSGLSKLEPTAAVTSWASARVAKGDLAEEIQRLKQEPGKNILAQGGVEFARNLVRLGLVDEYRLVILPVVLGAGAALFSGLQHELDLTLVSTSAFQGGVVAHVYRPAAAPVVE